MLQSFDLVDTDEVDIKLELCRLEWRQKWFIHSRFSSLSRMSIAFVQVGYQLFLPQEKHRKASAALNSSHKFAKVAWSRSLSSRRALEAAVRPETSLDLLLHRCGPCMVCVFILHSACHLQQSLKMRKSINLV